jgi:hypothetical protein
MKSSTLKITSGICGGLLLMTILACAGAAASGLSTGFLRVANYSNVTSIDTNITSASKTRAMSHSLPSNATTCADSYAFLATPNPVVEITAGGSTVNLFAQGVPLANSNGVQTILVYGGSTNLKLEVINSDEIGLGMDIFVADLSITDTSNYQVIIKDLTHNTQTQTSPVSGVDGSRHISLPITIAANYEVDLVSGGTLKASGTVNIDSTHQHNIVSFTDNGSGGFISHTINAGANCTAP